MGCGRHPDMYASQYAMTYCKRTAPHNDAASTSPLTNLYTLRAVYYAAVYHALYTALLHTTRHASLQT